MNKKNNHTLSPWDHAYQVMKEYGWNQEQIDKLTFGELQELLNQEK